MEPWLTEKYPLEQYGILDYCPEESERKKQRLKRLAFNAQKKLKFDLNESETESECLLTKVKFDERNPLCRNCENKSPFRNWGSKLA